jgi:TPP-dependent pyruvate/acetoin dehydrogenase alpha subunit
MAMNFPEYNFYTSAIVGGICPIVTGTAWSILKQNKKNRVYAFIGDMTSFTGICAESIRYSMNFDLPITWIITDNNRSVCTETNKTWNEEPYDNYIYLDNLKKQKDCKKTNILYFQFRSKYPHSATGVFLSF